MSLFVNYGDDARFVTKVLTIIIVVETLVIAFLGFFSVKKDIVYINPSNVIGTARVGYVPDDAVAFFGMAFLSFIGNVNPYSVFEQYKSAYELMSPRLQSGMLTSLNKDIKQIGSSNISIQTIPLKYTVVSSGDIYTLNIEAVKVSYAYGQESQNLKLLYTIKCDKTTTSPVNPFGLEVLSYDWKVTEKNIGNTGAGSGAASAAYQ